jgi:hypothetical protein
VVVALGDERAADGGEQDKQAEHRGGEPPGGDVAWVGEVEAEQRADQAAEVTLEVAKALEIDAVEAEGHDAGADADDELKDAVELRAQERQADQADDDDGAEDRGGGGEAERDTGEGRGAAEAEADEGRQGRDEQPGAQAGRSEGGPQEDQRDRPGREGQGCSDLSQRTGETARGAEEVLGEEEEGAEGGGQGREPVGEEAAAGGGEAGVADPLQGDRQAQRGAHEREEVMQDELAVVGEAELGQAALPDDEAGEQRPREAERGGGGGAPAQQPGEQPAAGEGEDHEDRGPRTAASGAVQGLGAGEAEGDAGDQLQEAGDRGGGGQHGDDDRTRRALLGGLCGASVTNEPDLSEPGETGGANNGGRTHDLSDHNRAL